MAHRFGAAYALAYDAVMPCGDFLSLDKGCILSRHLCGCYAAYC